MTTQYDEPKLLQELGNSALNRLLLLFPNAAPVNIPVSVRLPARARGASEKSTIVFGARNTVIFTANYPLNCGEEVHVRPAAGLAEASAVIVAIMPNARGAVVAARFRKEAPNWFHKP